MLKPIVPIIFFLIFSVNTNGQIKAKKQIEYPQIAKRYDITRNCEYTLIIFDYKKLTLPNGNSEDENCNLFNENIKSAINQWVIPYGLYKLQISFQIKNSSKFSIFHRKNDQKIHFTERYDFFGRNIEYQKYGLIKVVVTTRKPRVKKIKEDGKFLDVSP